jgi:calpain-15
MKTVGLVDAHAYSLIKAREIKTSMGKIEKILLIRNPWGKKEWNGDWSDNSK